MYSLLYCTQKATKNFVLYMAEAGYLVAVVNVRDSKPGAQVWHPGLTRDAYRTLQHTVDLYRGVGTEAESRLRIYLVGYSAGGNIAQKLSLHQLQQHSRGSVSSVEEVQRYLHHITAVFCVCVTYEYYSSLRRLETTSCLGAVYSYFMARVTTSLCPGPVRSTAWLLSALDEELFALRGYTSLHEMHRDYSMTDESLHALSALHSTPILFLQPADDPLHCDQPSVNLPVQHILAHNPDILYCETKRGNHFGFYEGTAWDAFRGVNNDCYTYPAKLAKCFFDTVLQDHPRSQLLLSSQHHLLASDHHHHAHSHSITALKLSSSSLSLSSSFPPLQQPSLSLASSISILSSSSSSSSLPASAVAVDNIHSNNNNNNNSNHSAAVDMASLMMSSPPTINTINTTNTAHITPPITDTTHTHQMLHSMHPYYTRSARRRLTQQQQQSPSLVTSNKRSTRRSSMSSWSLQSELDG
jgi:predicted alpha/beta-fold hydrolase